MDLGDVGTAGLVGRVCIDVALFSSQPCLSPGLYRSELALGIGCWGSVAQQEMSPPSW